MEVFRSEFKVIEHFVGTRSVLGCPMLVFKLSAIKNPICIVFFLRASWVNPLPEGLLTMFDFLRK